MPQNPSQNDQHSPEAADIAELLAENERLTNQVTELRKEYDAMVEEKSEIIRTKHLRIQEIEAQLEEGGGKAAAPKGGDLVALSDELERDRAQLEQDRKQLEEERQQIRDDEEAMSSQMRSMELQMSKERAELARQRNELQRLHSEIRHELELSQRDAAVNERLKLLQRRSNEVSSKPGGSPPPEASPPPAKKPEPPPAPPKKESGIFGRFFGSGDK